MERHALSAVEYVQAPTLSVSTAEQDTSGPVHSRAPCAAARKEKPMTLMTKPAPHQSLTLPVLRLARLLPVAMRAREMEQLA